MDLFGPNGCDRIPFSKTEAIQEFIESQIAYALTQPRHPTALKALADELEDKIRLEITPDLAAKIAAEYPETSDPIAGWICDYNGRPAPLVTMGYLLAIGLNALNHVTHGKRTIGIGRNAGYYFRAGSRCILLGDNTLTPTPDCDGFVNIDNRLCFWRDTGEIAECPAAFVEG